MGRVESKLVGPDPEAERRFNEVQSLEYIKFTWYNQRRVLPSYGERVRIAADLHGATLSALEIAAIGVLNSIFRTKTDERIKAKSENRLAVWQWWPLRDIYGVRVVIEQADLANTKDILLGTFLESDDFPFKLPASLDYNDPNTKRPREMHPDYRAIHLTVAFGGQVLPRDFRDDPKKRLIPHLGEIQIMTPEQAAIEERTRIYYEREQYRPRRKAKRK